MAILVAMLFYLLDKQIGYMEKFSITRLGIFLYSTNRRLIITTISSTVIITGLLFLTIPLGLDIPILKLPFNLLGGLILALGYCQNKINNRTKLT